MQHQGHSRIVSVGAYLPPDIVHPRDVVAEACPGRFGIDERCIENNMGINEVRYSDSRQLPSDLAIRAARKALEKCDVRPDEIGAVIFTGIERDHAEPATAYYIQDALGIKGICFDVSNACLGFMTGIQIANEFIGGGTARYVLVCTGERTSELAKSVARHLRSTKKKGDFDRMLGLMSVGDAGGAMVLGPKEPGTGGIVSISTESVSKHAKLCYYKLDGGTVDGQMKMAPICAHTYRLHEHVFGFTTKTVPNYPRAIDCCITHQVGRRPFDLLAGLLRIPVIKMTRTYPNYGNITSATPVVNLAIAEEQGKLAPGNMVYMALSGSGISVSHAVIQM